MATPYWHQSYPPSVLTIEIDPQNGSRLRPDYIAARELPGGITEFALVESKGTSYSLNNLVVCPSDWAAQARNAIVRLNNSPVMIPRYLVIGTRCNPNGVRQRSRRLQVRGWNSRSTTQFDSQDMLVEVMSAHYSGLCKNLGLGVNLQALHLAAVARLTGDLGITRQVHKVRQEADSELVNRGGWEATGEGDAHFAIEIEIGTIRVTLSREAISLMRAIGSDILKEELAGMIMEDTLKLNNWYSRLSAHYRDVVDIAIDRSGFLVKTGEVKFPNMADA